jgi:hypothetical protein
LISLRGERLMFDAMVERHYTDDGRGDGRVTLSAALALFPPMPGEAEPEPTLYELATSPAALLVMATRKEVKAYHDRLVENAEAAMRRPYRESESTLYELNKAELFSASDSLKYAWIAGGGYLAIARAQIAAERTLAMRDGVVVAMALELYHRREGRYPERLSDLLPAYLPAIPADRINGAPVHYKLVNGKPWIYSVGYDGDDDRGWAALDRGRENPNAAAVGVRPARGEMPDGDWVLFPQQ